MYCITFYDTKAMRRRIAFHWHGDPDRGIAAAKREAKEFGYSADLFRAEWVGQGHASGAWPAFA